LKSPEDIYEQSGSGESHNCKNLTFEKF
jgi:hypothetical protein